MRLKIKKVTENENLLNLKSSLVNLLDFVYFLFYKSRVITAPYTLEFSELNMQFNPK